MKTLSVILQSPLSVMLYVLTIASVTSVSWADDACPTGSFLPWKYDPAVFASITDYDKPLLGVFVLQSGAEQAENLTPSACFDSHPSWSPDYQQIAFASVCNGNFQKSANIYVMNDDGTERIQLTNSKQGDFGPSWSWDGSKIAFQSNRTQQSQIFVMDRSGSSQTNLSDARWNDYSPSWSPTDDRIVFTSKRDGNKDLFLMHVDGKLERLTTTAYEESVPGWAPDGKRIAYVSNESGKGQIHVMNDDGSNIELIPTDGYEIYSVSWSRAGDMLLATANKDDKSPLEMALVDINKKTFCIVYDGFATLPDW